MWSLMSGLCQIGVYLQGAGVGFNISKTFNQAVRAVQTVKFLKQGCCLKVVFKKGNSESLIFLQNYCSRSIHEIL